MPKERSIAKRLSGGEALDSLLHRVRISLLEQVQFKADPPIADRLLKQIYVRLSAHGHFHSHKAYHAYSAQVDLSFRGADVNVRLEFRPAMSFAPPLTDDFSIPFPVLKPFDIEVKVPVLPPNAVREESGMDMPVVVEENGVPVEKMVPAARYKGKFNPGQKRPVTANMDVPAVQGKMDIPDDVVQDYGIQAR